MSGSIRVALTFLEINPSFTSKTAKSPFPLLMNIFSCINRTQIHFPCEIFVGDQNRPPQNILFWHISRWLFRATVDRNSSEKLSFCKTRLYSSISQVKGGGDEDLCSLPPLPFLALRKLICTGHLEQEDTRVTLHLFGFPLYFFFLNQNLAVLSILA